MGILSVGSIYLWKSYFCKVSGTCNSMHKLEWVVDTSPNKKANVLPNLSLYMNVWCHMELYPGLSAYIALQVPDVGDAVHSPQLSGDRRHVCLLLHRQCGVQRTVWLPDPGQALPVLLKVSWSTHRHLTVYIHVYFSYYKKIYPFLKKKPTFLHVGRVHNALLFRNIGTCNVKCRWFNNEFYTCKYFWAEVYILNNLLFDKDMY